MTRNGADATMFITHAGMISPVGLSAQSSCAAHRAGISALSNLPYVDNAGDPIVGAVVPGIALNRPRAARLLDLLAMTLTDLLQVRPTEYWARVPLLVCLGEAQGPGEAAQESKSMIDALQKALEIRFDPTHSAVIATGHVAAFEALRRARLLIESGAAPSCVICGVDSLVNAAMLLRLDRQYRLKTPANRDGIIPGEAAAAVIVQARPASDDGMQLIGLGFGQEAAPLLSERPLLGRGLTAAARAALAEASLGLHEIDWRLSDVTGELYGFKELPLVAGRLMRVVRKKAQPLWHWAETIGDTGAAAGIAQIVLAHEAFRKGYAPGKRAICFGSAISGARAAAIVQKGSR